MPVVVAIPARNEEDLLPPCLESLAAQTRVPDHVVVLVNNSGDATAARARAMTLPYRLRVIERTLPPAHANAGFARRLAMRSAARLAGPDGILLCTDADARCPPDWIAANLRAIERGADAVAGMAELDPADAAAIPASLHEDDARECAYAALLDQIANLVCPDPCDPMPRHDQHSGASIACTAEAYARAGGLPAVATGEDRAFFAALARTGARIRHAPDVRVIVSGRTSGRAAGGMADTIRRRLTMPDPYLDDRLEPAADALRRARLRRAVRRAHACADWGRLSGDFGLPSSGVAAAARHRSAGAAFARLEALLPRIRVAAADLPRETADAGLIIASLRLAHSPAIHPADNPPPGCHAQSEDRAHAG